MAVIIERAANPLSLFSVFGIRPDCEPFVILLIEVDRITRTA
jgi:hypothetical protein